MKLTKITQKVLVFVLCTMFLIPCTAMAKPLDAKGQIMQIASKYGINVSFVDAKTLRQLTNGNDAVNLSAEDFDGLLKYLKEMPQQTEDISVELPAPSQADTKDGFTTLATPELHQYTYTWTRWAPFKYTTGSGLLEIGTFEECTNNCNYAFNANGKGYFYSNRYTTSRLTGTALLCYWTQTGDSWNATTTTYTKDTMKVQVTGHGNVGIKVLGIDLSIPYPTRVWNFTLIWK